MNSFINRFDRFAPSINLKYKGQSSIGSLPGAVLTIIAYLCVLSFISDRCVTLVTRQETDINSYSTVRSTSTVSFPLQSQHMDIAYKIVDTRTQEVVDLDPKDGYVQFVQVSVNQTMTTEVAMSTEKFNKKTHFTLLDSSHLLDGSNILTDASI